MRTISANINVIIKACEKASKTLIRDFGEIEKLQVSVKGPSDFVSSAEKKAEKAGSAISGNLFHRADIGTESLNQKKIKQMSLIR